METKESFRKRQKTLLKRHAHHCLTPNFRLFKELESIIAHFGAKKILLFLPLPYEPDLTRFRNKFAKKCKIFVPFMQDENLKMVKLRNPLLKGRFGIYEPLNSPYECRIDLAVVPVLGVDKQLRRIGHGFGFYDKFFQNLGYKPLIIFVSALKALCEQNLGQKHDIQADFYINPYQKFYKKVWKNGRNFNRIYRRSYRRWDRIYSR